MGLPPAGNARAGARGGDGALGFWRALREVIPETREQRCRFASNPMFLSH
ncbi:possible transposase (plasmid) [Rhodococcus jostii RHA1]|uniref:Possible transposase n=1 Tax=Rhodococcus jostii (strain RHA1) TaxID=101510 RepID=Q0RW67_RHOJR|nr:possible transposase [Rhodococcus jostii RHA1]